MISMKHSCMALILACSAAAVASPQQQAKEILDAAGVKGGLVVHVGCADPSTSSGQVGKLTAALRANDSYLVQGLDADAANVDKARAHIQSLGVYGKVSVDVCKGARLPYADNLVNLVVADDLGQIPMAEVMRVLAPEGVAYVGGKKTVKPRPAEIDEWTHYLHNAGNNAVAKDTVVGPPRRMQWTAGPTWGRSHDHLASLSALVSSGGRIFYVVDEGPIAAVAIRSKWVLIARDAFSGVQLWRRPIGKWEGHLRNFRSGPTELARRLVAVGDRVYVTLGYDQPVVALDAATGETVRTYEQTDNALEIIAHDGVLLTVVGDRPPDNTDGAAKPVRPKNIWHWWPISTEVPPRKHLIAIRAETGDVLWRKDDADTHHLMPTTLAAAGKRVYGHTPTEVLAMDAASGRVLWRAARPVNRRRPTWSTPTLVVYEDVVLSADRSATSPPPGETAPGKPDTWIVDSNGGQAPQGRMVAFEASTGKKLWESDCRECYNSPVDVLVADGLVWSGSLVKRGDPGITVARDVRTGEVKRTRPRDQTSIKIGMGHHRCYRNKATTKYLVLGRDGIEFINMATGKGGGNAWVRGTCQYGVMPCNGLIYAPPHSCACHIESKLNNFNALAPAGKPSEQGVDEAGRLEKGPAYGMIGNPPSSNLDPEDWATFRHDAARSGRATTKVSGDLKPAWTAAIGGRLSVPVAAGGRVFVASIDIHTVHALSAADGQVAWSFIAGGRVDSPPTVHEGSVVFGCADGWIYCLRAADGVLAWRFRAAARDRRVVSYGQVESAWPVHGSVLVQDGAVYAVAGRSGYLDGGMRLVRVDARTGRKLSETPIEQGGLPDVLSSDGTSIYLRHKRFDTKGVAQTSAVPHLYSSAGFLDGTWWHRTYWQVGTAMSSGWGSWPNSGLRTQAGRLLVLDGRDVYGFGRLNQYHRDGSHVGLGTKKYMLYASSRPVPGAAKKGADAKRRGKAPAKPTNVSTRWTEKLPLLVRGMVLSGKTLFVAGPPDTTVLPPADVTDTYHVTSEKALQEQDAALAGERGALLRAVSAVDGKKLAELKLNTPPVFDGMIAARGRLFVALEDGSLMCLTGKSK